MAANESSCHRRVAAHFHLTLTAEFISQGPSSWSGCSVICMWDRTQPDETASDVSFLTNLRIGSTYPSIALGVWVATHNPPCGRPTLNKPRFLEDHIKRDPAIAPELVGQDQNGLDTIHMIAWRRTISRLPGAAVAFQDAISRLLVIELNRALRLLRVDFG